MAQAVGSINREIQELAPVINSPSIADAVTVAVRPEAVAADMSELLGPRGIAVCAKNHGGRLYLFAVRMEPSAAKGTFALKGLSQATARVIGEKRTLRVRGGRLEDDFGPYAVHLYEIEKAQR
jgi:hypothetical protein